MAGRITYNGINIDFPRPFNRFDVLRSTKNSVTQGGSGIEETLNFYTQDFIEATKELETGQIENEVRRFVEYARDGSTFSIEEDRSLGAYFPFEGAGNSAATPVSSSRGLKSNDDVAGTFTVTGVTDAAYYLEPSTGLMTVAGATGTNNVPRFPAGKYGYGILIEGAQTNLITSPSDLSTTWVRSAGAGVVTNTPNTKDPAGTSIADTMTQAAAGTRTYTFTTSTAVGSAAYGCFLKTGSGTATCTMRITGTTGGSVSVNKTVDANGNNGEFKTGNGWGWYTISTDGTGLTGNLEFELEQADGVADIYHGGSTGVAGQQFIANPIGAASTSSITRNAEKLTYLSANIMNRDKGTVAMWVKPNFDPTANNPVDMFFESGDSAGAQADSHIRFYHGATLDRMILEVRRNNLDQTGISYTATGASGLTQNNWHHIGATWDATISNGGHIYVDGSELSTGSSNDPFNASETGDTIAIGSLINNTLHCDSTVTDVVITKDVKDATWFKHVFNKGRGYGVKRNRWASVRLADVNYEPIRQVGDRITLVLKLKEVLS